MWLEIVRIDPMQQTIIKLLKKKGSYPTQQYNSFLFFIPLQVYFQVQKNKIGFTFSSYRSEVIFLFFVLKFLILRSVFLCLFMNKGTSFCVLCAEQFFGSNVGHCGIFVICLLQKILHRLQIIIQK
eukprot:TRINITY_DN170_c0_g2_i3.p3 TRINITY_DN170_c0_g2~~TRINITY_DN170_c0_g2_i3.p3  ORF type:complete len:126 (+),score=1.03 TRINITY_DN170_c0_g2_i3:374-751(+)